MSLSPEQTKRILLGNYKFSQLGFSMLITRLRNLYYNDSSADNLQNCTTELNNFLRKYHATMGTDFQQISSL
ncbi:MAG: hypothetical protein LBR68_00180 [Lachnoclostridium sp.]|nr:hypothetical protein [Lachnoclostridium sp.]